MKILHIAPHYGGGIGTVVSGWLKTDHSNAHRAYSLELCKERKVNALFVQMDDLRNDMKGADIALVHYWDNSLLTELFSQPIPDCRLTFWVHKNFELNHKEVWFPDKLVFTSPIQNRGIQGAYNIWSTGDMSRFLEIKPKPHKGFNVGYVGTVDYKKLHHNFISICKEIAKAIPDVHFIVIGEMNLPDYSDELQMSGLFTFTGKVDDVAPYLAEMDCFGYPLRPDNYGTCEQSLGEAMAGGVVPVVMDNPAERTIINHRKDGLIASSEDKYVKFIKHLYDYPDTRAIMSDLARERSKKLYSIDTMIFQWNEVFEEMMRQPKKARSPL